MSKEFPTITLVKMYLAIEAEAEQLKEQYDEAKASFPSNDLTPGRLFRKMCRRYGDRSRFASEASLFLDMTADCFVGAVNLYTEDPKALEAKLRAEAAGFKTKVVEA